MKNLNVIVEIPKNSAIKYEYDRKKNKIIVDRILRNNDKYPTNYGFVPNSLDWDGDELDVLIISEQQFMPGVEINVRVIGAMKMIDEGETDTKLITVHADDYSLEKIQKLDDLKNNELNKIKKFFLTYKKYKGDVINITGFENEKYALKELDECICLSQKYGKLSKDEFITMMKKKYPEKYL